MGGGEVHGRPRAADSGQGFQLGAELDRIAEQLKALARVQDGLHHLYETVLGRDVDLAVLLRQIVATAMELVDARYGALGVLNEDGESLAQFIPVGLSEREKKGLAGVDLPEGRGLLGYLITHPEPLRVDRIGDHPASAGFPPGHPPMRTLLGVAISSRGRTYGRLYVSERADGRPFDAHDEAMIVALAGAAGLAIDDARLFSQVRAEAEQFQRLLLPRLPDLRPFEGAALYLPAPTPGHIGGDWYDALLLPDGTCVAVIGDVGGHGLGSAAAMAQIRSMLRALVYERPTPPSEVLTQLDRTLQAITDTPVTTTCLARIEPAGSGWSLHWSTAGHPPPLLVTPGHKARYLTAEPGVPLGVDSGQVRPDHHRHVPGGSTVVFFTDGLIEDRVRSIDDGLHALADLATASAGEPPDRLCRILADDHPSDGTDDIAILAIRTPGHPGEHP
jgi:serine phosphatase RsbU (regulator of sigma subunit)